MRDSFGDTGTDGLKYTGRWSKTSPGQSAREQAGLRRPVVASELSSSTKFVHLTHNHRSGRAIELVETYPKTVGSQIGCFSKSIPVFISAFKSSHNLTDPITGYVSYMISGNVQMYRMVLL